MREGKGLCFQKSKLSFPNDYKQHTMTACVNSVSFTPLFIRARARCKGDDTGGPTV